MTIDDDDKIRRNLVVASVAVLLSEVFDFQVSQQPTTFMGVISAKPPTPGQLWTGIVVLLVYFLARYRFESGVSKALDLVGTTTRLIANDLVRKHVINGIWRVSHGRTPYGLVFSNVENSNSWNAFQLEAEESRRMWAFQSAHTFSWRFDGEVAFTVPPRKVESAPLQVQAKYRVVGLRWCWLTLRLGLRSFVHSKLAIDTLFPFYLAGPALFVAVRKAIAAF